MSNIHGLYHQRLDPLPPAEELGRIHFVGIGGVGMAPVARVALERGLPVSGSDIKRTAAVEELERDGAVISIGQKPENLDGVDTVVVSTGLRGTPKLAQISSASSRWALPPKITISAFTRSSRRRQRTVSCRWPGMVCG